TADALDDRQPEPQPARHTRAVVESMELPEDHLLLRGGNADAGVVDLDHRTALTSAYADQHLAVRGVLDRVRHQVLQESPQQPAVGTNRQAAGQDLEVELLLLRDRLELHAERIEDLVEAEHC